MCGDWPGEGEGLLSPLSPHHLHITLRLCQLIITLKCDPPGENKSMSISCTVEHLIIEIYSRHCEHKENPSDQKLEGKTYFLRIFLYFTTVPYFVKSAALTL